MKLNGSYLQSSPIDKLHADPSALLADAESKPSFQADQQEARERRLAQLVCSRGTGFEYPADLYRWPIK